ncbi:hypothetical protein D6C86_06355 [Aureobasidium pullulans]|uniref:Transmembrane protein n=1 Tax=Aureobasidium pullulans TaxID=5580 RepID=A0A4S9W0S3_AURPU|nr:hypothetical protein D6D28_08516 [Aureobasidium pullulans]THW22246.1 hypothetical protein D6D24_01283 [Aureobasidium pullulans]THY72062.1 hypothetical protein D6C94_07128 [Aureobasidium pullulans]THZ24083.1 hypothetical protein D6C89_05145 [Aureobasidium pullulans]THZ37896.1 hypothetical protein D6C87_08185 [Aureobasidium pullulans]
MGGRLSVPKGPAGTTEISHPKASPFPRRKMPFNSRTVIAPAAAFTMACILFVYTRTSIRAAKANAQRHRDADSNGEGLDLLAESRRRHGRGEKLDQGGGTLSELAHGAREQFLGSSKSKPSPEKLKGRSPISENEEKLRAAMGRKSDEPGT